MADIIDAHEAARFLGISRITVYRKARDGSLPAFRVGSSWKFDRDKLDHWIQRQYDRQIQRDSR